MLSLIAMPTCPLEEDILNTITSPLRMSLMEESFLYLVTLRQVLLVM